MQSNRLSAIAIGVATLLLAASMALAAQEQAQDRRERFRSRGASQDERKPGGSSASRPSEALAAFDDKTNGYLRQGPPLDGT